MLIILKLGCYPDPILLKPLSPSRYTVFQGAERFDDCTATLMLQVHTIDRSVR